MANALEAIRVEVARNTDVTKSAIALIQGLKARVDAAIDTGNDAALKELSADLSAHSDQLAAAVAANTPADPDKPKGIPSSEPKPGDTGPSGKSDPVI